MIAFVDSSQGGYRLKQIIDFLLARVNLAMTFVDIADRSNNEELVRRNDNNARKVYDAVVGALKKLPPRGADRREINMRLALLKARLAVARG